MKLLLCLACEDIVRLFSEFRTCRCGKTGGRYTNDVNADVWGPCIPVGIDNRTFRDAIIHRTAVGEGVDGTGFTAFIFPLHTPHIHHTPWSLDSKL